PYWRPVVRGRFAGGGGPRRRRSDQGRGLRALRGDGAPPLSDRRPRTAPDRIAAIRGRGDMGRRAVAFLRRRQPAHRALGTIRPDLGDRAVLRRDDRAVVHAADRDAAGMERFDRGPGDRRAAADAARRRLRPGTETAPPQLARLTPVV